jgi:uncharacterized protein YbaP (TraB family)
MRFKIPCKKSRFSVLIHLLMTLLVSMASLGLEADQGDTTDRALFWAIQKQGQSVGYLLGTIHSEDPRVLDFSEDFLGKLQGNEVFAMELVPDLSTLARLTEYMLYPDGQSLESVIGIDRFQTLSSALSTYKVPAEFVSSMKPWAAMMTLSTPPPVTGFFMDFSLSLRASGSGLKVVGLETLEQQLSFLEDMPEEMQLSLLDQAIAEYEQVTEVHDQMVSVYLKGDLHELQVLSTEQMLAVGSEARDYFMETGINARNHRMLASLLKHMEQNSVFAAVGALHLPGEQGLINLLRQQGFELMPMGLPFLMTTEK